MIRIGLFELLLGLIAGTCASRSAYDAADHRTGRPSHCATDRGATKGAASAADTRAGLVVTLGRLAGNRATGPANRAADDRAGRSTDHAAYDGPANGARGATDGLTRMLLVLRRGAVVVDGHVAFVVAAVSIQVAH
jgi:hypothetical protein